MRKQGNLTVCPTLIYSLIQNFPVIPLYQIHYLSLACQKMIVILVILILWVELFQH